MWSEVRRNVIITMIKRFCYGGKWDNAGFFIDMLAADAKTANKTSHSWAKPVSNLRPYKQRPYAKVCQVILIAKCHPGSAKNVSRYIIYNTVNTSWTTTVAGSVFSCLSAAWGSNRVTDSVLMGSEMSNKAPRSLKTARADTKLTDKGQTDRFHTLTEGRTSRKAAGSREPQMDTGEELLYIRAGGKFQFSIEKCGIWN